MTLIEIVAAGLKQKGYSGLVIPGVCGCQVKELSPAECLSECCKPGYSTQHSINPELWAVGINSAPFTDDEIEKIVKEF